MLVRESIAVIMILVLRKNAIAVYGDRNEVLRLYRGFTYGLVLGVYTGGLYWGFPNSLHQRLIF